MAFARQGAEVVGIDISVGMLKYAYAKHVSPKPTWLEMDATNLCFRDGAFDISTISLALHHMLEPTQRSVLAEIDRVTRRRIVIVEPHTPANPRLWPLWAVVYSRLDESEHLREWVRQDFTGTCRAIGLKIAAVQVTTFGMHRITICTPNGAVSRLS